MCNLSDGIEQREYNRGKLDGKSEGKSETIIEMLKDNPPLDLIEKFSYFSRDKILEIGQKMELLSMSDKDIEIF